MVHSLLNKLCRKKSPDGPVDYSAFQSYHKTYFCIHFHYCFSLTGPLRNSVSVGKIRSAQASIRNSAGWTDTKNQILRTHTETAEAKQEFKDTLIQQVSFSGPHYEGFTFILPLAEVEPYLKLHASNRKFLYKRPYLSFLMKCLSLKATTQIS